MTLGELFVSLTIREDLNIGEFITPPMPIFRPLIQPGPYFQRRLKRRTKLLERRWRALNPTHFKPGGKFYLIDGRQVLCHPVDVPRLRAAIDAANTLSSR